MALAMGAPHMADEPLIEEDPADPGYPDTANATTTQEDDGSITVEFGEPADALDVVPDIPHDANLADYMDEAELSRVASTLVSAFEADKQSRRDWAEAYMRGLDLLGMKIEDRQQPWVGASGVFHPMLTEAVVRFQAQAMGELLPASGPAKSKIMGKASTEKVEQAQRVQNELNYQITERMPEYRDEMEQMLFKLPLAGSAFKKVYYDPVLERPVSVFVPAEDFVTSYGTSNLRTSPRYTHVMRKTDNEIRIMQVDGFYSDFELTPAVAESSEIGDKYDDMEGVRSTVEDDPRRVLLEMHVDLDLPEPFDDPQGILRPYVVTIDKSSRRILSIRRNWYEDDPRKLKRMHFVHYPYLPGMGFYGTGLTHLIGGLAKSATSILRQLIDAGTLANLPAGLKARGMRIKGDDTPIMPGEFRDVDVPGGTIKDNLAFLPYKEPSATLYQLLGNVVEEGRRIGSVADLKISDMSAQAPVGTTLALLERSMKVMSGVQARLHAAMKTELRLLARIITDYMPPEYDYMVDDKADYSRQEDFDDRKVDIIPVSDPNASTMAQRIMQYQSALQLAAQAPQLYDMGKLHKQMLDVLGIQGAADIIKLPGDIKPSDPIAENMAMLKQEPVKAFLYQDHDAHIKTHTAAIQDPKLQQIIGQSPFASAIQSAMMAHITEHVAYKYRADIEANLGVALPPEGTPLPEDIEIELSRLVAQAASKLLDKDKAEAAAQAAAAQQADPLTQIQQRDIALREKELEHRIKMDMSRLAVDAMKTEAGNEIKREQIDAQDRRAGAQVAATLATTAVQTQNKSQSDASRLAVDVVKHLATENAKTRAADMGNKK